MYLVSLQIAHPLRYSLLHRYHVILELSVRLLGLHKGGEDGREGEMEEGREGGRKGGKEGRERWRKGGREGERATLCS